MTRGGSYHVEPGAPINPNGDLFPTVTPGIDALIQGATGALVGGYTPPTEYLSGSGSAAGVDASSFVGDTSESPWGAYDQYMQMIKEISESNTARSIELADRQNAWQQEQNKIAMDFNALEAQKNRDWQKMMSDTSHQREVEDLIAAGLNPVLSAGGNGAPMGTGSAAEGVTSAGARGSVDDTYAAAGLNFLNNIMDYASRVAASMNSGSKADAYLEGRKYAADMQYKIAQDFPGNGWRMFDSYFNSIAQAAGYDSGPDMVGSLLQPVIKNVRMLTGKGANDQRYASYNLGTSFADRGII